MIQIDVFIVEWNWRNHLIELGQENMMFKLLLMELILMIWVITGLELKH